VKITPRASSASSQAPPNIAAEDKKALEEAIARMVKSDAWKKMLDQREWVDLYMPAAEFTAFVKEEQTRVSALLTDGGRPRRPLSAACDVLPPLRG